jgi:thymidylate synthase (FAD)
LAREAARYVLPEGSETALIMTGNFRAWRHFIHLRVSPHAMPEMRLLAAQVTQQLQEKFPAVFGDFTLRPLPDGTHQAVSTYHEM